MYVILKITLSYVEYNKCTVFQIKDLDKLYNMAVGYNMQFLQVYVQ